MSKASREKKEKAAKGLKQPKAEAKPKASSIPNEGKCCTCKSYRRRNGCPEPCAKTGKYTPRKATCGEYKLR